MLKNTFRFELKRGIKSNAFKISMITGALIVTADFILFYEYACESLYPHSVIEAWIGTDYKFAYNNLFYILLPILSALPFGASYYEDISSGYIKNILIKTSRGKYYMAKYAAVFLLGALSIFCALFFSFVLCMSFYPMLEPEKLLFLVSFGSGTSFMAELNNMCPTIYIVIYIVIDSVFAGMIAVFSVCMGEMVNSRFSAIATPFSIYVISSAVLARPYNNFSLMYILNPQQPYGNNGIIILGYGIILSIISFTWIYQKSKRKEIY